LISLQQGEGCEQLRELGDRFAVEELDRPGPGPWDFLDTAAVMKHLDLVVTPDTAVAHLAGGLGLRAWVALPFAAEWRWLADREDSPWYPTLRLFRQQTAGDWDEVFQRMADILRQDLQHFVQSTS
jgi:ADP-heptose:LPS heptosyltransferase